MDGKAGKSWQKSEYLPRTFEKTSDQSRTHRYCTRAVRVLLFSCFLFLVYLFIFKNRRMKNVLPILFVGLSALLNAQNAVRQVLVVNEGYYDYQNSVILEPVTVGSYNPVSGVYQTVNTLGGMRFASDAIIAGDAYYVAADQKIFKFDLSTHQSLAEVTMPGVRNLAFSNNKIVASRGEYLTTYDSYLHIYNASDLSFVSAIDTVSGPKWATQNLISDGNFVYVAINNGYEWGNEKGIIGRLDMNTLTYGNEIDLGPDGKNPDNMLLYNGHLYTINNKDWSGASISRVSLDGASNSTVNIASASTGCGTSALRSDRIVYQISGESVLNEFDAAVMNNVGPISGFSESYYELAQDPISGFMYMSVTDYFSFGKVNIYDNSNTLVSSFDAEVSPGTIVFDVQPLSGISETMSTAVSIYPNPANEQLNIITDMASSFELTDLSGKIIAGNSVAAGVNNISLSGIPSGTYVCTLYNEDGTVHRSKITKN
jgi:hypothetical protein